VQGRPSIREGGEGGFCEKKSEGKSFATTVSRIVGQGGQRFKLQKVKQT